MMELITVRAVPATPMPGIGWATTELVISNSGHWLMEEEPAATIAAIRAFLTSK